MYCAENFLLGFDPEILSNCDSVLGMFIQKLKIADAKKSVVETWNSPCNVLAYKL